ncbi:MAG: glycosyltransferase family 2 protein [bacterium]
MHPPVHVSILIPAYNEERSVGKVVGQVKSLYPDFELIVINDGSDDRTAEEAEKAGGRVRSHPARRGYGASLKTGLQEASGEIAVFMDADGEHKAEDVKRLVEQMKDFDMVVGARQNPAGGPTRRAGKKILFALAGALAKRKIPDLNSGFRALRRNLALPLLHRFPDGFSLSTTLTLLFFKKGYRVGYLPIEVSPRVGESKVKMRDFFKTLYRILKISLHP